MKNKFTQFVQVARFALLCSPCLFFSVLAKAQNVAINADGSLPNANAILDVKSYTQGMLLPRTSTTSRLLIPNTKGLLVYDTTNSSFWYNTGTAWAQLGGGSATSWSLTGNAGTNYTNYIGTSDGQSLRFMTNGLGAGMLDQTIVATASYGVGAFMAGNPIFAVENSAFGGNAMHSDTGGANNVAVGYNALYQNSWGSQNTAVGFNSLFNNNAFYNTAVGMWSLYSNTTGWSNVGVGISALHTNTTDHNLVAFGDSAMFSINNTTTAGSGNTAIGSKALYSETGTGAGNNTAVGYHALTANTTGAYSTAAGYNTLAGSTTGSTNDAFGYIALQTNQTGSDNAAFGAYSLHFSTQNFNTGMGVGALSQINSGSSNTALGYNSGQTLTGGSGNIIIGSNAQVPSTTGSNQLSIGNWIYGSSGKISIGTTAVNQQLTLNAGMNIDQASANGASLSTAITFGNSGGSMSGEGIASNRSNSGTGNNQYGLDFYTDFTKRMSVANNGYVGIGTAAPTATLSVNGTANKPGGGSWAVFSDARLKQNIRQYTEGLDAIMKIKPVVYHYNTTSGFDTNPEYVGVIAQDLKEVAPYMVNSVVKGEDKKEYYQVDNSAMTYMLINAVKELKGKNDAKDNAIAQQAQQLTAQQATIDQLKKEMEDLKALIKK